MTTPKTVFQTFRLIGSVVLAAVVMALACQSEESHPNYATNIGDRPNQSQGVDYCATPNEGCECVNEGEVVDCGRVKEVYDDYVICSEGTRTCTDGKWGPCMGETIVQRPLSLRATRAGSLSPTKTALALGGDTECTNACDPHCTQQIDTSGGFDAGVGFDNTVTGLTLERSALAGCETLTIAPSGTTATVTGLGVSVTAAPITLTATLSPDCMSNPFPTAWTVDRFDIAQITGTDSSNGKFTVVQPIAGDVKVTAYAAGLSASVTIRVKVNVTESTNVAPNTAVSNTLAATLTGAGTAASRVTWLYPYANTHFPLGLLAPVVQYWFSTETTGGTTKVSLRYPVGTTASTADFNYSIVVKETNTVSNAASPTTVAVNTTNPQVVIPQAAWKAFEQTARGKDAALVIQRLRNNNTTVEYESARTIHLVNGQLKGTVFYNSYSSQMGGVNTGAVLAIKPGASSPSLAVQPSGKCAVCHTINADGTKMIAAGARPSGGFDFNNSRRYDISNPALWPSSSPVLNSYNASTTTDVENTQGDRFNFGAVWKDGSLYMTHGGNATNGGDKNWRAPPDYSRLYNPASDIPAAISVANWTNISAVTPKFSIDGTKLAFGYWGKSATTLPQSPTGTLTADTNGRTMVVVDFGCSTSTCTGSSTGWKVTNARNVTPGLTNKVGWPSFTPDGSAVLYQQQYRSAKAALTNWSPSDVNTVAGALAEIWMSNVPADKTGTATPTRLRALNGLDVSGSTSYLPTTPGTGSYHAANASFTINQADACNVSASVSGVNDYQLNYLPAMAPVQAGGMNWVVFTSRRMYGNIAYDDPWDAEPGPKGCINNTVKCTCTSGTAPTKKLWIAAIDSSFTPGTDPSHPAFYLPGQELMAGNSDGYWVASQCVGEGQACSTSDDCCGGTGSTPTARCSATTSTCQAITACTPLDGACSESADCCAGLVCGGTGTCVNPLFYATQTYRREYVADCPEGTQAVWRFFEWQSVIPTGTSIQLAVQTKQSAADSYTPATAVSMDPIVSTSPDGIWVHGTKTVDTVLHGASGGGVSQTYLLVSMTFVPDTTGTLTPSLTNWRQAYDCLDAQ